MENRGFTLIELLVVISIISLLASMVLASFGQVKEKAKIARAKAEVNQLRAGIELLMEDTGKGPGGCPLGVDTDTEMTLDADIAALTQLPPVSGPAGTCSSGNYCWVGEIVGGTPKCLWTLADQAKWHGPYIPISKDPWGHDYLYDPDYPYELGYCDPATHSFGQAVYSEGPNTSPPLPGQSKTDYPCTGSTDDIYLILQDLPHR